MNSKISFCRIKGWLSYVLRRPLFWIAIAISVALVLFTTPVLPDSHPWGMGNAVRISSKDSRHQLSFWMPPLVSAGAFLAIEGNGIDAITWSRYNSSPFELDANGKLMGKLIDCPSLPIHGLITVRLRQGGWLKVTLLGGHDAFHVILFAIGWLFVLTWLRTRLLDSKIFGILAGAISLRFFYAVLVPWNTNAYDVMGHLIYIRRMAEGSLPVAGACWQCYQPPLAYIPAACLYHVAEMANIPPTDLLRLAFLFLSCGFLYLGARIIEKALQGRSSQLLGVCLFAFWPWGIYGSPVINNDVPMNFMGMASMWALSQWMWQSHSSKLWLALLFAGIAACIKTNGVLYFAIVGVAVLVKGFSLQSHRTRSILKSLAQIFVAALLASALLVSMNLARAHQVGGNGDYLVGNINQQRQNVPEYSRSIADFLPLPSQLRSLYTADPDFMHPNAYAQGFWTNFLRSSIALGFPDSSILTGMVYLMCSLLFLLIFIAFVGAFCEPITNSRFHALAVLLFLGAAMAFRWRYPFSSSANLRYVAGILVPFTILVARGTEYMLGWKNRIAVVAVWTFIALSIGLYTAYSTLWM